MALTDSVSAALSEPAGTSTPDPSTISGQDTTPPVIAVNGNNPAYIKVGDTYEDLGATITGPQADLNLGIKTFLNGALVSNIVLDTSAIATDTVDYVATDTYGNTAASTRTVIVEALTSTGTTTSEATTNAPTSTTQ